MIITSQCIHPGVADVSGVVYDPRARHAMMDGVIVFLRRGVRIVTGDMNFIDRAMRDPEVRFETMI
jgi:hypothetical protein